VILLLGRLGTIVVLVGVVPRRSTVDAWTIVMMWLGPVVGVTVILVVAVGFLGVLHVGVLVDHRHQFGDRFRVGLEHLAPELNVVQPLVEVVDDVPVINLCNRVMVSKVPLVVVTEGFVGLLGDIA
jgi:hypothetical protein